MDFSKLIPLVRTYALELSDQEVADAINARKITRRRLVPLWIVKQSLIGAGVWAVLLVSDGAVAKTAVDYINDRRFDNLDFDLPETKAMVGGLVASGLLTTEQATALDGLANESTSIAELNGLPDVSSGEVWTARHSGAA